MTLWAERAWAHKKGPILCWACDKLHGFRWGWPCPAEGLTLPRPSSNGKAAVNGSRAVDVTHPRGLVNRSGPAGAVERGSGVRASAVRAQEPRTVEARAHTDARAAFLPNSSLVVATKRGGWMAARALGAYVCDSCGEHFEVSDKRNTHRVTHLLANEVSARSAPKSSSGDPR